MAFIVKKHMTRIFTLDLCCRQWL